MRNRSHPLRVWLLQNNGAVTDFATTVGITAHYLYSAINRERPVSPEVADKIRLSTNGRVDLKNRQRT